MSRLPCQFRTLAWKIVVAVFASGFLGTASAADRLEFWTISLKPTFTAYVNEVIEGYEAAHPGVKIDWLDLPPDGYQGKLLAAIASGTAPDVVNINVPWTQEVAQQGGLLAIDPWVGADRELYLANALKDLTLDGKLRGLPWYNSSAVLAMNADIFRKAGLDPKRPPRTFKDYIAYAAQIKKRTGMYGFMPGTNMLQYFMMDGLPIIENGKAVFNSPRHVALVQMWADAFEKDLIPRDALRRGDVGAVEMYSGGKLGMLYTGPQFLMRVRTDNPAVFDQTVVDVPPLGAAKVLPGWLMSLSVPKGAKNPAEAVRFAKWVTNDENQLKFSKLVVIFPSVKKAAADPFFHKLPAKPSAEDYARVMGARGAGFNRTLVVTYVKNLDELRRNFAQEMEAALTGQKPVKQALDDAAGYWNSKLDP